MTDNSTTTAELPGFELWKRFAGPSTVTDIAWSSTGDAIAVAYAKGSVVIWWLNEDEPLTLPKQKEAVVGVAWSEDDRRIVTATRDYTLRLWDSASGRMVHSLQVDSNSVRSLFRSPDRSKFTLPDFRGYLELFDLLNLKHLKTLRTFDYIRAAPGLIVDIAWRNDQELFAAVASAAQIVIIDISNGNEVSTLSGHSGDVLAIAWEPQREILVSGSADRTIWIWDIATGRQIATLEGHTAGVTSLSFSADGTLLASKSQDGTVSLWDTQTWLRVAEVPGGTPSGWLTKLSFHPFEPNVLATPAEDERILNVWRFTPAEFAKSEVEDQVRYSNAKVVLVGDTGVGKSGLSLVLTAQPWTETGSTHGRRVLTLDVTEVDDGNGQKVIREVLLWDLAGQPDYRLIHQLNLTEVAVALIVFDARSVMDPFSGVKHWDRALRQAHRVEAAADIPLRKLLVAARSDVGRIGIHKDRIEHVQAQLGLDGYFETSAKENWGVEELRNAVLSSIDWTTLPYVTSTKLFQSIKSFVVQEKAKGRLLSSVEDLYRAYTDQLESSEASRVLRDQFETCIGRLNSRGLIQRLSFGNLILLQPELRDTYAAALVNSAKDEPDGLGCINEADARAGAFRVPSEEKLPDVEQERLLLIATVEDLLLHEIALRETGEDGQYLVFPSQLTRENPDLPTPEGMEVIVAFEGPIMNVYATLVVRLSRSGIFRKLEMWKNAVTFETRAGVCGFALREIDEARAELLLFFDEKVSRESKLTFQEFVLTHVSRRALPDSVTQRVNIVCPECGIPISEMAIRKRFERGYDFINCNVCDPPTKVALRQLHDAVPHQRRARIAEMDKAADQQRQRETAALSIQGKIATRDYDVFLCHKSSDKQEVKKIAEELKAHGILPWLDAWELRPGLPWQRALEDQIGHIKSAAVFVGSSGIGPWQRAELDAFLREFVRRGAPVIPVILPSAAGVPPDLPIFLQGHTWVDFRRAEPEPLTQLLWGITGERSGASGLGNS